jgi:N-acetyl-beta-hexosaminidase
MANATLDLNAIINASVADQAKVMAAVKAARDAKKAAEEHNALKTRAANQVVSTIQKETAKVLKNAAEIEKEAYQKAMVDAGLTVEAYPLESALLFADQSILTPALQTVGKIGKGFSAFGNFVKSRVVAGYKA